MTIQNRSVLPVVKIRLWRIFLWYRRNSSDPLVLTAGLLILYPFHLIDLYYIQTKRGLVTSYFPDLDKEKGNKKEERGK